MQIVPKYIKNVKQYKLNKCYGFYTHVAELQTLLQSYKYKQQPYIVVGQLFLDVCVWPKKLT